MKYTVKKLENKNVEIEITLSAEEWEKELTASYNKNKGKYKVEGFRQGKAPRKFIEKIYGEHIFFEDALSEGFYNNYGKILEKEKDLEPVDAPMLDVKSISEKGAVIVAEIPVKPDVVLKKYKGLGIKKEAQEITDKEINKELKKVQEQNSRLVEAKEDALVKKGDVANIDFSGSIDGKVFDGGTSTGFDLEIGSKSFIDTFEDQLIGLKVNDEKDVVVTFPSEYHAQELAGKEAVFKVKINAIKNKELPKLDDELASNVSEFSTLEDYKKHLKETLTEKAEEKAKIDQENKIIEEILKNMEVEIPHCMIHRELDDMMRDMEYRLMYQGMKLEDYAKYLGTTVEKIRAERHVEAEKSVKVKLALQEIVKLEKLDVSKEEYDAKVKELAKSAKKTIAEYKKMLSEQRINYIKNDILMNKLLNFLVENNG